jgi:hypothetical protein
MRLGSKEPQPNRKLWSVRHYRKTYLMQLKLRKP